MRYLIAYVPYTRREENIELIFCDTIRELLQVIVENIGCAPVEYEDGFSTITTDMKLISRCSPACLT
mgnify:CR=1 FL=1